MKKFKVQGSYRDEEWLETMLANVWHRYFSDVAQDNEVKIIWGRKAKQRLGSISLDPDDLETTIIRINPLYQDLDIPEEVIEATIVHEMIHYAHGFNSPHEQQHYYPHSGGVVRREFAERDLEKLYLTQKKWLKANWPAIIERYFAQPMYVSRRAKKRYGIFFTKS